MTSKVWFVTGASRGFGRLWTEAALARGDKVAATARNVADLAPLKERYGANVLTLELDVAHPESAKKVVEQAHAHFGRLDIVMNNAGYSLVGTIEEVAIEDVRAQFETNYFGTLRVIQAALPLLRKQGSGHIVGVSSGVGLVALPVIGFYCSSKFAFEALHDSLAQEVKRFGINVTLLEPNAYATEFGSPASLKIAKGLPAYEELRQEVFGQLGATERGDPPATVKAVFEVLDMKEPPLRFLVGSILPWVRGTYEARLKSWETYEALSNSAQGSRN